MRSSGGIARTKEKSESESESQRKSGEERSKTKSATTHASQESDLGIGNCLSSREKRTKRDFGKVMVSEGITDDIGDPVPPAER
ncbi:hypothetical protein K1719_026455 [Acacia pycnantha]|nr:hypothetical protein K1719_026455 [Acacia pycnantha]